MKYNVIVHLILFFCFFINPLESASCVDYTTQATCIQVTRCAWSTTYNSCVCGTATDIDLLFVMDRSGSVGSTNWVTLKDFAVQVVQQDISSGSRVAAVTYSSSDSIFLEISFNDGLTGTTLTNKISGLSYRNGGTTWTRNALQKGIQEFQNNSPSNPRLLLLLTDGVPNPSPDQNPSSSQKTTIINENIDIFAVGIGSWSTSSNPVNTWILGTTDGTPIGSFVSTTQWSTLGVVRSQLQSVTCPANFDFEITEMRWSSGLDGGSATFIELLNTGDGIFMDGTNTVLEFGTTGSIRGSFKGTNGITWASDTFLVLYRTGGTALQCYSCTCASAYGITFSTSATSNGDGACASTSACCSHTIYMAIGSGSADSTGIYFASTYSNTNFDVEIKLTASDGGGTIIDVAYTTSFPAVTVGYTFEKSNLYASESSGSSWSQSCWPWGTPGDEPVSPCTRTCDATDCTANGDTGGYLAAITDTTCTCTMGLDKYYPDGCSCLQIKPPSNCIGTVEDNVDSSNNFLGTYAINTGWTVSPTSDVTYTFDYNTDGVSGSTSLLSVPYYTQSVVQTLSGWTGQVYAVHEVYTATYSSPTTCSIITKSPTAGTTPTPTQATPVMTCAITIISDYIVIYAWGDSTPAVSNFRYYNEYGTSSSSNGDTPTGNNNCATSEISSYVTPYYSGGYCKKVIWPSQIVDTTQVNGYMSPYVYDGNGNLLTDNMLNDRVLCTPHTFSPSKSPTIAPLGAPTQSPARVPTTSPTPHPVVYGYEVISCTVRFSGGDVDKFDVYWTYTLATGHDTDLLYGSSVNLQWNLKFTNPIGTAFNSAIDLNDPNSPQNIDFSDGLVYATVSDYAMYSYYKPYPTASYYVSGTEVNCKVYSESPTVSPTTLSPTKSPIKSPTKAPTNPPSKNPTNSPTYGEISISNCIVTLDDKPIHDKFNLAFTQPTFNYPYTPQASDVQYYIAWTDGTSTYSTTENPVTGSFSKPIILTTSQTIGYGWEVSVTLQFKADLSTAGDTIYCTVHSSSPTPNGYIYPTSSPSFGIPEVYFDLSADFWIKYCDIKDTDSCSQGDCIPSCQIQEKASATVFNVLREPEQFPNPVDFIWRIYCCDVETDSTCLNKIDSCDITTRRLYSNVLNKLNRRMQSSAPAPTATGYVATADEEDFNYIVNSTDTVDEYPTVTDGSGDFDVFVPKNEDPYNPEQAYIVLTSCTSDNTNSIYDYGCQIPQNNPNKPNIIRMEIYNSGTGAFTSKKTGDYPEWIWAPIAGGLLFLALLAWAGYRYYQKRKFNEELLEQRKHELGQVQGHDGVDDFGGIGDDVQHNPLATGGTVDIATTGDFVDKQLGQQQGNFEVAQVEVNTEIFKQDFGPQQGKMHKF